MNVRTTESSPPAPTPGAGGERVTVALETPAAPSGDLAGWVDAAAGVLRKAGRIAADEQVDAERVLALLATTTADGITVPPLGTVPDDPAAVVGPLSDDRRAVRTGGWDVRALVPDTDPEQAGAAAVAELEGGATSLLLPVGGDGLAPADLDRVLRDVLLDIAGVALVPAPADRVAAARALLAALAARQITGSPGTSCGVDLLAGLLDDRPETRDTPPAVSDDALRELADAATAAQVSLLVADGVAAHEAGAGDVTELAWTVLSGISQLRRLTALGVPVERAAGLLTLRVAVTDVQFVQLAKLRALRALWSRVLRVCGVDPAAQPPVLHAVTSRVMTTRYDPWVNMLRGTVATFAAGAGGADAVTTLPFDSALGVPDALGRRVARNVSHLLTGESHVADVADPAGGAPAVEQLTTDLAAAAWDLVQQWESAADADGTGDRTAVAAAVARERIAREWAEQRRRLATRRAPLTGVSEFPHADEQLPQRPAGPRYTGRRWAQDFEELRDTPCAAPVFVATLGPVAAHSARAGFVTSALAAGGVRAVTAGATTGVDDVAQAFRAAPSPVAVLAGPDTAYDDRGLAVAAALREAGALLVLLAGRPRGALAEQVDGALAVGADLPAVLTTIRDALAAGTEES